MGNDGHNYPEGAGWKDEFISEPQAEELDRSGRTFNLIEKALSHFERGFTGTADDLAAVMREHVLSVRPTCTLLRKQGFIVRTGDKKPSITGRPAAVLSLKKISDEPQGDLFDERKT